MNSLTRIMSYDKTKVNQENCISSENVKLENQINYYPSLSEEEIERIILERYLDKDLSNITSSSETLLNNSVFIFLAGIVATIKITSIIFARKGLLSKRYEIFSYIGTVVLVIISLASILTLDNVANDFTSPISFLYIPNAIFLIGYGLGQIGMINDKKIKCLLPLVFISFIGFAIIGFLI